MLTLMNSVNKKRTQAEVIRSDVTAYLYDAFTREDSPMARLDRWTQRRVSRENLAKLELVLEANDPVEHCYQNLVREIAFEAETGVFLAGRRSHYQALRAVLDESGVSGTLHLELDDVASALATDGLIEQTQSLDAAWESIESRFDRAAVDTHVSQITMAHLAGGHDAAVDITTALRALLYAFHEDTVRQRTGLTRVLDDRGQRDLGTMTTELVERAGDCRQRVADISARADRL